MWIILGILLVLILTGIIGEINFSLNNSLIFSYFLVGIVFAVKNKQ
jgi:hypothetical protein